VRRWNLKKLSKRTDSKALEKGKKSKGEHHSQRKGRETGNLKVTVRQTKKKVVGFIK